MLFRDTIAVCSESHIQDFNKHVGKIHNYLNFKSGLYRISTELYTTNSFFYQFIVIFNDVQTI